MKQFRKQRSRSTTVERRAKRRAKGRMDTLSSRAFAELGTNLSTVVSAWFDKRRISIRTDGGGRKYKRVLGVDFFTKFTEGLMKTPAWTEARKVIDGEIMGVQNVEYKNYMTLTIRSTKVEKSRNILYLERFRSYGIINSPEELQTFCSKIPPGDRFLEEIILTDTPHRFYLDIEKEFDTREQEDPDESMRFMQEFLEDTFVPHLVEFFSEKLMVPCTKDDWMVTDSSKPGVKFSTHLVLTTPENHYCRNRVESWIISALLAASCEAVADSFQEFADWYRPRGKRVVDYSVYSRGHRNFRILGSCKPPGSGVRIGASWKTVRPFLPVIQQENEPWTKFVATVNEAPRKPDQYAPIEITSGVKEEVKEYLQSLMNLSDRAWAAPLMGVLPQLTRGVRMIADGTLGQGNVAVMQGEARRTENSFLSRLGDLLGEIKEMGKPTVRTEHLTDAQRESVLARDEIQRNKFLSAIPRKLMEDLVRAVHPGQSFQSRAVNPERGEILAVRSKAFVQGVTRVSDNGEMKPQRLCFWSYDEDAIPGGGACEGGSHEADFIMMVDYSVEYYCHSCKHRGIIVESPIRPNTVTPVCYDTGAPPKFESGYIDYAETNFLETDRAGRYMRPVKAMENGRLFHPDHKRTIVLHGGMGTGKSTVTSDYLERVKKDVRETLGREPRVISITFRQMLAHNNAKVFDMELYSDSSLPSCLFGVDNLAIQLDSISRIVKAPDLDNNESDYTMQNFDVLILDESESILAHLSSETMKNRRDITFRLLLALTRRVNTVICGDADTGRRTRYFMLNTRFCADTRVIPGLEYHRNQFVANDLFYLDYKSIAVWVKRLSKSILDDKHNVFICSNNKKVVHRLKYYLLDEIETRLSKPLCRDREFLVGLRDAYEEQVVVLDADIPGASKKIMAEECNDRWSQVRVLMITPVVGAGLSYDRETFHEAFVYGSPHSCPPRELMQLLGRVRKLIISRCHVFLHVVPPPKNPSPLALTLREARDDVRKRQRGNLLELLGDLIDDEDDLMRFTRKKPDRNLSMIRAMNLVEQNLGKSRYRDEFIRVLQNNNPDINYRFNLNYKEKEEMAMLKLLHSYDRGHNFKSRKRISEQDDADMQITKKARRDDNKGELVREEEEKQKEAISYLRKNELRNIFRLDEEMDQDEIQLYLVLLGGVEEKRIECIENAAQLFFTSTAELYKSAQQKSLVEFMKVLMKDGSGRVLAEIKSSQRATEEYDPLPYRVRHWFLMLLYIGGFEGVSEPPKASKFGVDSIPCSFVGHSNVMARRLQEAPVQKWLKEHGSILYDFMGVVEPIVKPQKPKKDEPPPDPSHWHPKKTTVLIKYFFRQVFNIRLSQRSKIEHNPTYRMEPKVDKSGNSIHCCRHGHAAHGKNMCRELRPSETGIRLYMALLRNFAQSGYNKEDWLVKHAGPAIETVCDSMNIKYLPGMMCGPAEHQSRANELELDPESFAEYCFVVQDELDTKKEMMSTLRRGKKKKKKQSAVARDIQAQQAMEEGNHIETQIREIDEDDQIENYHKMWDSIVTKYIGPSLYTEVSAAGFVSQILSGGYKTRTKKAMTVAVETMNTKRNRKMVELREKNLI